MKFRKGEHDFTDGVCFVRPETGAAGILPAILRSGVFKELKIPKAALKVLDFIHDGNKAKFTVVMFPLRGKRKHTIGLHRTILIIQDLKEAADIFYAGIFFIDFCCTPMQYHKSP